mmetsp:Transcript_34609/g.57997  ORF Transcript_34609/g.57997 Transcript_34609/m.57997 type:complete len:422 (+) Transcript_34609:149-1414(+)
MEVELREAERKLQEEKKKVEEISVELVNLSIRAGRSDDVVPLTRNIQPSFPTADVGLQTIPIQPSLSEDSRSQNIQIERLTQRLSDFEALLSEKTDEARAFEKKSEAASLRADEALTKYRTSILSKMQTLMKGQDDTVNIFEKLLTELMDTFRQQQALQQSSEHEVRRHMKEAVLRNRVLTNALNARTFAAPISDTPLQAVQEHIIARQVPEDSAESELEVENDALRERIHLLEQELTDQAEVCLKIFAIHQKLSQLHSSPAALQIPQGQDTRPAKLSLSIRDASERIMQNIQELKDRRASAKKNWRTVVGRAHVHQRLEREKAVLAQEVLDLRSQLKSSNFGSQVQGQGNQVDRKASIEKHDPRWIEGLRLKLKEFTLNTQQELERERLEMKTRCLIAEEQLSYFMNRMSRMQLEQTARK